MTNRCKQRCSSINIVDYDNSYLSLQETPFGEVVGGPQSAFSFDLFMEVQTGNLCDCTLSHEQSHLSV